jgi:hypothetical protein
MNIQYISDSKGQTTGVYIPINEWNLLKSKYKDIEQEAVEIPEWQKEIVRTRLHSYKQNPTAALDFDGAMDEIEGELNWQ